MFDQLDASPIALAMVVFVLFVLVFWYMAYTSQNSDKYRARLSRGEPALKACGWRPNCVCSEHTGSDRHYIAPVHYQVSEVAIMKKITQTMVAMGGHIQTEHIHYVHAEFKSRWFGFVDDVEVRIDAENRQLHFRSASRQGNSDFKVNRRRIHELQARIVS